MTTLGVSLNSAGIFQAQAEVQQSARQKFAPKELTPEQQQQVAELQQIDRMVRAHEQAHLSAGYGVVTSGANFSYTYGPDGRQYAVGGEVGIDTSAEEKPEANIDKGIRIQAAALAPKDPSPQDYRVASIGSQLEARGRSDLSLQQVEERTLEAERSARQREQAATIRTQASATERQRVEQAYVLPDTSGSLSLFA